MMQKRRNLTCCVCNQQFNSERDLQEHQNDPHSRRAPESQSGGYEPTKGTKGTMVPIESIEREAPSLENPNPQN
jgi:hypothetical protein